MSKATPASFRCNLAVASQILEADGIDPDIVARLVYAAAHNWRVPARVESGDKAPRHR